MQEIENIKINLRGVGCTIVRGTVEDDVLDKMSNTAKKFHSSLEVAIFDNEFFECLNIDGLQSWQNFDNLCHINGLSNNPKSFIEIRKNNRTILKVYFKNIFSENLLFPLYNTEVVMMNKEDEIKKNITIAEHEIGLIASYKFTTSNFQIEKLKFCICKIQVGQSSYSILYKLFYDNKELKSSRSDTLVSGWIATVSE